jgi:hypothetical protein
MSNSQLAQVDKESEISARMKANRTDEYVEVSESLTKPFVAGLIHDYKKSTQQLKLLPGYIEGSKDQCLLQAQYLLSKIKAHDRIMIENKSLAKPGYILNAMNDKNNCGNIDSCYISDFNNNEKEIQRITIRDAGSCIVGGHAYIEIFCYFKPAKSGTWTISSGNIKSTDTNTDGADKFKLWIKSEKAVYDHLYANADIKSVGDSMKMFMNKNVYYPLRIHIIGRMLDNQTESRLASFSLLDMFKYDGDISKNVKLERMFNIITGYDDSLYKPNLVYYGLVKQSPTLFKCYFVDPNVPRNFALIEELKYNCPNFLTRREQLNITLGNLNAQYVGKPGTKLTAAPNFKFIPPYGDISSSGGVVNILPITVQQGSRPDLAKWNAAITKYDADLLEWKRRQQERHNAWLRFWGHFSSWWTFNWNKYRAAINNRLKDAARKIADAANSAKRALEDAVKRADNARKAAEANWKKYRDLWNSFYAKWLRMNAAQRRANQAKYNKMKRDSDDAKVKADIAKKDLDAAIAANNKPQPAQPLPTPDPEDPGAIELQKSFADLDAALAERKKMMDEYLLLVSQQSQIEAPAVVAKGMGAYAGPPQSLISNTKATSRDTRVMSDPINKTRDGKRADTKTSTRQGYRNYSEGFSEGLSKPNISDSEYQIPIYKTYDMVSTNKTNIRVTPKSIEAQKPDWEKVENTEFPASKNFTPEHPGTRSLNIPLTLSVSNKEDMLLYIDAGRPMLKYRDVGSTEPIKAPLSNAIRNGLYFKIWDGPPTNKDHKPVQGEGDLKFGDIYVVCGTEIDQMTNEAKADNRISYARLACFGFAVPAIANISPNNYWIKTDIVKCSSSRGRQNRATSLTINDPESNELVSPKGYFLLSFEKKNESDTTYNLYMKFGRKISDHTDITDTFSKETTQPVLSLLRPITQGLSNNIYQMTHYKDSGIKEARPIPRNFKNMLETKVFTKENGKYFPAELALTSGLGIDYKIPMSVKDELACGELCKVDPTCQHYFYETNKNPKVNRCILDQSTTKYAPSTFKSTSSAITGSVLYTKQLQTLADKSTIDLFNSHNKKEIKKVNSLGYNTDIIYNDIMIRDNKRYVGWAISEEINNQTKKVNDTWSGKKSNMTGQPISGVKEGFTEGNEAVDNLEDALEYANEATEDQQEYISEYRNTNDYIHKYHTAQKDLYGSKDVNNQQTSANYDSSRDAKGALFIYKTNDSEYVIPSKFSVLSPEDPTTPATNVEEARQEDLTELLLQQNSLYTIGTLTAATFLMTAIVLARE